MTGIINFFPRPPSGSNNLPVMLLRYCIETAQLAGYENNITPELLYKILASAPRSNKDVASDEWVAKSFCWLSIDKIADRVDAGKIPLDALQRVLQFWVKGFAAREPNLRKTLLAQLQLLSDACKVAAPKPSMAVKRMQMQMMYPSLPA